ncbi:MAG: hypothetical protein AB7N24_20645 [Dehalococcoidia bacterium]
MTLANDLPVRPAERTQSANADPFRTPRVRGKVIGSRTTNGAGPVAGVDTEKVISIEDGSLRIGNPILPGWGRHVFAKGPIPAQPGTWIAATILNGHNSSQGGLLGESLRQRCKRWLKGAEVEPWKRRVVKWAWRGDKRETLWLFRKWWRMSRDARRSDFVQLEENLAFGWMRSSNGGNPVEGACFVMRAAEATNGELCIGSGGVLRPLVSRVTNIPIAYFSVVRNGGVAFLVGTTVPNVPSLPMLPMARQIAVVPAASSGDQYACIQQAALGQVGFVSATHVYGLNTGRLDSLADPRGTALFVDSLRGSAETASLLDAPWEVSGRLHRSPVGLEPENSGAASLRLSEPAGFLRVAVERQGDGEAEIRWRSDGIGSGWGLRIGNHLELGQWRAGEWSEFARSDRHDESKFDAQVLDDGLRMRVLVNGRDEFGEVTSTEGCTEAGLALALSGAGISMHDLEVQPRAIRLPEEALICAPTIPIAPKLRIVDAFAGTPGPLDGRRCENAAAGAWERTHGHGAFVVERGLGARVDASPAHAISDRTSYTLPWPYGGAATLEILVAPPGGRRGLGANGRAGVVFWQDEDNYFIVSTWLDDGYDGASISAFFRIGGTEEIYNAVWSNVGDRVDWARDYRLRVAFDGDRFVASVDGEPVLVRALSDVKSIWPKLQINRVGMTANWEWGLDAGSVFREFRAWSQDSRGDELSTGASGDTSRVTSQ